MSSRSQVVIAIEVSKVADFEKECGALAEYVDAVFDFEHDSVMGRCYCFDSVNWCDGFEDVKEFAAWSRKNLDYFQLVRLGSEDADHVDMDTEGFLDAGMFVQRSIHMPDRLRVTTEGAFEAYE